MNLPLGRLTSGVQARVFKDFQHLMVTRNYARGRVALAGHSSHQLRGDKVNEGVIIETNRFISHRALLFGCSGPWCLMAHPPSRWWRVSK